MSVCHSLIIVACRPVVLTVVEHKLYTAWKYVPGLVTYLNITIFWAAKFFVLSVHFKNQGIMFSRNQGNMIMFSEQASDSLCSNNIYKLWLIQQS